MELNGRSGTAIGYDGTARRFAVELYATRERKLIKEANLSAYAYDVFSPELCLKRFSSFNLNAFPACNCEPSRL